jgi:hypothetical protein
MTSRRSITVFILAASLVALVPAAAAGPAVATPTRSASVGTSVWPTSSSLATSPDPTSPSATGDFVSDLDGGTALPPSKGNAGVEQLKKAHDSRGTLRRSIASASPAVAAVPLPTYRLSGIVQRPLPVGRRPYDNSSLYPGITDSSGVRMFRLAGDPALYNHPVGQAQVSMAYLYHYGLTGRADYLRLAEANAQRLVDRRVESRGGWYFPYDFDFAVHGDTTQTLKAPWYSGMAQGQALSAFTRLFQVTQNPVWKAAADATYASLDNGPVQGEPFGSWVSSSGDLWLEEYPRWPVETSERVLNGHIFAAFGIYDYAQLTGSADAMRVYDGALTTVTRYLMAQFRSPNWASKYSLRHGVPALGYHQVHVTQMLYLQNQTGNPLYTTWANILRADFPLRTSVGFGVITPSTKVIYQLNTARQVVRTRAVKFVRSTGAPVDRRERAAGGPIMLHVSAGAYTGWWFPEAYAKARIRGAVDVHTYSPDLRATFASGTYVIAYRYNARNQMVGYKWLAFTRQSQAPVTKSAIVDGKLAYFLPTGAFAGCWVSAGPGIAVR